MKRLKVLRFLEIHDKISKIMSTKNSLLNSGGSMRLDKYLKVSRIIKRRPVAKEVADKGRIKINGVLGKSSTDLKLNDQIEIRFGNKLLTVRVLEMKDSTKKEDAQKMYEILSEKRIKADEQEWQGCPVK